MLKMLPNHIQTGETLKMRASAEDAGAVRVRRERRREIENFTECACYRVINCFGRSHLLYHKSYYRRDLCDHVLLGGDG